MNKLLIRETIWVNLRNILSDKKETQMSTYYRIPIMSI